MNELFPIASGLVLGAVLALVRPGLRLLTGIAGAVLFGVLATVASGEYLVGWEFLIIDIPLVALSAAVGLLAVRAVLRGTGQPRQPRG
ncbi:hypothetical protein OG785_35650 [Streptomyces sp. NBC_00006]|uniref:hypothetical protein n=1 Tax=Streptomyces sp. NBC_00006 TaxID=2975619 RepID=UPI00224C9603|nr:hypothetical protein [Streptomyces sp. NBC_00006]MCX5535877.1 hypothetical protein [Streptomyces sp. NBC_00006]